MCEWGDTRDMVIRGKRVGIDRCIYDIVYELNCGNNSTLASCCGHGKSVGAIALADGRELIIARDYDEARSIESRVNDGDSLNEKGRAALDGEGELPRPDYRPNDLCDEIERRKRLDGEGE